MLWSRNFCDMAEISANLSKILYFSLKSGSNAIMSNMRKMRNFIVDILILEISAIWQKFLPFLVKFAIFALNRAHRGKWWMYKWCGTEFWIPSRRNFYRITEISTKYSIKWPNKANSTKWSQKFLSYCRNFYVKVSKILFRIFCTFIIFPYEPDLR